MSTHQEETETPNSSQRGTIFRLNVGYLGFAAMLLWVGSIGSQWQSPTSHEVP